MNVIAASFSISRSTVCLAFFPKKTFVSEKPSKKELVSEEPGIKTKNAWHIRDKKYIPDKYIKEQIGTIVIARDFVSMVDYKNAFGSITENKNLANTWRMFFQFIWDHLK